MNEAIYLKNYDFFLPRELIANRPATPRDSSKLLIYDKNQDSITHTNFIHFFDFIDKDYLFVLNDTSVIKARFFATKRILNKKYEFLYHRFEETCLVQIRNKVKLGDEFTLDNVVIKVVGFCENGLRRVIFLKNDQKLNEEEIFEFLNKNGVVPIPPYIKRESTKEDEDFYNSVFSKHRGAIAAPTASLHFSNKLKDKLLQNYDHTFVTLHIGYGTFKNVDKEIITNYKIHSEFCKIQNLEKLRNKKILCIGTTALRAVEWGLQNNISSGFNDIFLHPFNKPKFCNSLLTNFHLPKSSLLMLVSSIIGLKKTLEIYEIAKSKNYRFYSYGDCMLIKG